MKGRLGLIVLSTFIFSCFIPTCFVPTSEKISNRHNVYSQGAIWLDQDHYADFLRRIKIVVHSFQGDYERYINFGEYIHLFHAQGISGEKCSMCLIGVEDLQEQLDGWTDVLLPIFYSNQAENQCQTDDYVFYVDLLMTGAYPKDFYFYTREEWQLLFSYSSVQMKNVKTGQIVSVGYIEYWPSQDKLCY